MINDKQRREVAARIRERLREGKDKYLDALIGNAMSGCVPDGMTFGQTVADLIDRPTCETIEHGRPDESHVCKSCSRCSYGWFEDIHDKPYSYCPNCGAEVVDE